MEAPPRREKKTLLLEEEVDSSAVALLHLETISNVNMLQEENL